MAAAGTAGTQIHLMALGAEFILTSGQKTLHGRTMRQVTEVAFPVLVGNVYQLGCSHRMATAANLVFPRLEQPTAARLVGIMAGYAIPPQDRLMDRWQSQPFTRFVMAFGTHLPMGIDRQSGVIRTMGQMATQAILILERSVNDKILPLRRFHGVTAEAEVTG